MNKMTQMNWIWIAYIMRNKLITKFVENSSNMDNVGEGSLTTTFGWYESPEGWDFWNDHFTKAINE